MENGWRGGRGEVSTRETSTRRKPKAKRGNRERERNLQWNGNSLVETEDPASKARPHCVLEGVDPAVVATPEHVHELEVEGRGEPGVVLAPCVDAAKTRKRKSSAINETRNEA